ncbi:tRNA epoxyqueuosine(34) reductase QueG [Reinekea forsetii]|nr:tRNA epoxyqueuosine(34) reductase QueG [Reinekea forsetii]
MSDSQNTDLISTDSDLTLPEQIRSLSESFGFADIRFSPVSASQHLEQYQNWVAAGYNGTMQWMERNIDKRFDASELHPGTKTVITVRMDYHPNCENDFDVLKDDRKAYIARYALGRDYHKVMRKRLTSFGKAIEALAGHHGYRAFVDSAPIMERQLAEQSGLGWIGKNSLLLVPGVGSWFFLGELMTDLDLPKDPPLPKSHCGSCNQCIVDCPTDAFVADGVLDARKCISYLTIEYSGSIPTDLRSKMGNRIYGCDDCQLVCPHNNKAPKTEESDYNVRHNLDNLDLLVAFSWDEETFLSNTEGSAIRRIGFEQWQRNIAIAIGNGKPYPEAVQILLSQKGNVSDLVDEHIDWAVTQLQNR